MYLIKKKKVIRVRLFFFASGITKVPVSGIIPGIIKTSSNNCLILGHDF